MKSSKSQELQDVFMGFHQKVSTAFRREAKDMPFTMSQLEALRFITEHQKPSMKDVAAHLNVTAPSATAMVEQLFEKGLVKRQLDPADRRTVHILPTPKASKLFSSFAELKVRVFSRILNDLSEKDQETLAAILKKLL